MNLISRQKKQTLFQHFTVLIFDESDCITNYWRNTIKSLHKPGHVNFIAIFAQQEGYNRAIIIGQDKIFFRWKPACKFCLWLTRHDFCSWVIFRLFENLLQFIHWNVKFFCSTLIFRTTVSYKIPIVVFCRKRGSKFCQQGAIIT